MQGVSENMQQLITFTKNLFLPGQIIVINKRKAYTYTILLIIKMLKINMDFASYDVISKIVKNKTKFIFPFLAIILKNIPASAHRWFIVCLSICCQHFR